MNAMFTNAQCLLREMIEEQAAFRPGQLCRYNWLAGQQF
jgi:hypothetical protein